MWQRWNTVGSNSAVIIKAIWLPKLLMDLLYRPIGVDVIDIAIDAGGLGFDSLASEIGSSVPSLRCFFRSVLGMR